MASTLTLLTALYTTLKPLQHFFLQGFTSVGKLLSGIDSHDLFKPCLCEVYNPILFSTLEQESDSTAVFASVM